MALGAERLHVLGMIVRGAFKQMIFGIVIGLICAVLCVRFAEAILYELKGLNLTVVLAAILPLMLGASIAALVPARHAASVDPMRALRVE